MGFHTVMKGVAGTAESVRLARFAQTFSDYISGQQRHAEILVSPCSPSLSPCNCDITGVPSPAQKHLGPLGQQGEHSGN